MSAPGQTPADHPAHDPIALAGAVGSEAIIVPCDTVEMEPAEPTSPVSPRRAQVVLVALSVASFLLVSNEIAPMGLLGQMADDLGKSEAQLGLTSTLFALAVTLSSVPLALATTRMIRRWVVVAAIGIFTVGTLVAATADTFTQLLVARGITGLSHALFWAVVTPAAAGMFPVAQRGRSVARLLLGASAAGVVGLPGMTYLGQEAGWRMPFWVLTVGGALLAVVVAVLMPSFRTVEATLVKGEIPLLSRYIRVVMVIFLSTSALAITWTFFTPFMTDVAGYADGTVPVLMVVGGTVGVATTWFIARFLDRWPVKSVLVGQMLLLAVFAALSAAGTNPVVALLAICAQALAWAIITAGMVNWALRHSPWTVDIGNAVYATMFNAGNTIGSRIGAIMLGAWSARWLPVGSLIIGAVAVALVLTVKWPARRRS